MPGWLIIEDGKRTTWLNAKHIVAISVCVDNNEMCVEITMDTDDTYEYWTKDEDMVKAGREQPCLMNEVIHDLNEGLIVDLERYLRYEASKCY